MAQRGPRDCVHAGWKGRDRRARRRVAGQSQLVARVYQRPDTFIVVLDVKAKKVLREWKVPGPPNASTLALGVLSPDGKSVCAGADKAVHLWDVSTGKEQSAWDGHTDD